MKALSVEKLTQSGLPPSRRGKRRLELWLSPDAKKQVKLIAVVVAANQKSACLFIAHLIYSFNPVWVAQLRNGSHTVFCHPPTVVGG